MLRTLRLHALQVDVAIGEPSRQPSFAHSLPTVQARAQPAAAKTAPEKPASPTGEREHED